MTPEDRVEECNRLLEVIARTAGKFSYRGRIARFERDARGKVYFVDEDTRRPVLVAGLRPRLH